MPRCGSKSTPASRDKRQCELDVGHEESHRNGVTRWPLWSCSYVTMTYCCGLYDGHAGGHQMVRPGSPRLGWGKRWTDEDLKT